MSLNSLRVEKQAGRLSKSDFIDQMHELHTLLFEYSDFLQGTDICGIDITEHGVIMTERSSGVRFWCDAQDKRTAPIETLNFGTFEKEDEQALYQAAAGSRIIFDIGANIGWYSLNLAKRSADAEIYAFEPLPATFRYLEANAKLNALARIHLNNFGFSDTERELTFYFNPESTGSSSLTNLTGSVHVEEVRCQVKRLDDFVERIGVGPDFIKCDVEGAELLVFQGGRKTLERYQPVLFTEMLRKWAMKFGYHPNEIIIFLQEIGYHCFASTPTGLAEISAMDEQTEATNFVFLHRNKHAGRIAEIRAKL
jgi:FkbM family methyltransferase